MEIRRLDELAARGELDTSGREIIRFTYLWYPTALVADYLERATCDDLEVIHRAVNYRGETIYVPELVKRQRKAIADLRRTGRPWVRFDRVDRILTAAGLALYPLGDPVYARHPSELPEVAA
jgi:hypothetical protein